MLEKEKRFVTPPQAFHILPTSSHSPNEKQGTIGHLATSNQPAYSYYPQDVRPPPRRRATPIISRTRQLPPARLRNIADEGTMLRDCIGRNWRHKGRRIVAPVTQGWDGPPQAEAWYSRVYLRHPLDVPVFSRRALTLGMPATHSCTPPPSNPAPTCLIARQAADMRHAAEAQPAQSAAAFSRV